MLEKLIKNIGRKVGTITLAGSLLFGFGCATYKTMSPFLIQPVTPIERSIDYSKLTWQEAIEYVQTPEQAQDYLDRHISYDHEESGLELLGLFSIGGRGETFEINHVRQRGKCFDYATMAAALLQDNGYPPLILNLQDGPLYGHAVFLFRTKDGYGTLGNTPMVPNHNNVSSLIDSMNLVYGTHFKKYNIINLNDNFDYPDEWIKGDRDLRTGINIFCRYNNLEDTR